MAINMIVRISSLDMGRCISLSSMLRRKATIWAGQSCVIRSILNFCPSPSVLSCRSTKTQVNPSSALNRTKHHQSDPSNVPGIPGSNYLKRACIYTSKSFLTWSNRTPSLYPDPIFNRITLFRFYYLTGLFNLCCTRQRGLPLLFREARFTASPGT